MSQLSMALRKLYTDDWDRFCKKVIESDEAIVVQASDLPAFLYNSDYNSDAIDEGLLRGIFPVQVQ